MKITNDTLKQEAQLSKRTKLMLGLFIVALAIVLFSLVMNIIENTYTPGSIVQRLIGIAAGIYLILNVQNIQRQQRETRRRVIWWVGIAMTVIGLFYLFMGIYDKDYTLGSTILWLSVIGVSIYITLSAQRIALANKVINANPILKRGLRRKYTIFALIYCPLIILPVVLQKLDMVTRESAQSMLYLLTTCLLIIVAYATRKSIKKAEKLYLEKDEFEERL